MSKVYLYTMLKRLFNHYVILDRHNKKVITVENGHLQDITSRSKRRYDYEIQNNVKFDNSRLISKYYEYIDYPNPIGYLWWCKDDLVIETNDESEFLKVVQEKLIQGLEYQKKYYSIIKTWDELL